MTLPDADDLHDIPALVRAFEDASLDTSGFHHRHHLIVAAWLLETSPFDTAVGRMRKGLHALLAKAGKDAYHETVTIFWMRTLSYRLSKCDPWRSVNERIREAVTWAQTGEPLRVHYSAALLASPHARQEFVEPDLAPLPQPQQ